MRLIYFLFSVCALLYTGLNAQVIETYTTANSDLPSDNVSVIYIDTFNVAWIGTDAGIARFDGTTWEIINSSGDLINDKVFDIEPDKTSDYELWVGTEGGVSFFTYDGSGIVDATSFTTSNSELLNDTVVAVGVDLSHNKWFGTMQGISIYTGSIWDTLLFFPDGYGDILIYLNENPVNVIECWKDTIAYIGTLGGGVARYSFNEIDGFTGASPYDNWYSQIRSLNIHAIYFNGESQYFGTGPGATHHDSLDTKAGWYHYEPLDAFERVQSILLDDDSVMWFGTNNGVLTFDGENWRHYNMEHGLIYKSVNDIQLDVNGYVWLATDGGIQVLDTLPSTEIPESIDFIESSTLNFNACVNQVTGTIDISFDLPSEDNISMILYNLSGQQRLVLETGARMPAGIHNLSYNLGNYQPGVYLIKMISDYGQLSRKLLIVK